MSWSFSVLCGVSEWVLEKDNGWLFLDLRCQMK